MVQVSFLQNHPSLFFIKELPNSFLKCSMFLETIPSFTVFISEAIIPLWNVYTVWTFSTDTPLIYISIQCFLFEQMFSNTICHISYSKHIKSTRTTFKGAQLQQPMGIYLKWNFNFFPIMFLVNFVPFWKVHNFKQQKNKCKIHEFKAAAITRLSVYINYIQYCRSEASKKENEWQKNCQKSTNEILIILPSSTGNSIC